MGEIKKYIHIYYDWTPYSTSLKSYKEVEKAIENGEGLIETLCTNYFSFKYLDLGYEVTVNFRNGNRLFLSEALKEDNNYTKRNIRLGHNMEKLLLSGEFDGYIYGE